MGSITVMKPKHINKEAKKNMDTKRDDFCDDQRVQAKI
jgi:hypothetical protein